MLNVEVRTLKRESLMLSAGAEATVLSLKQQLVTLRQADGWASDCMELILQGRYLDDATTVRSIGLKDGDFLVVTGMVPVVIQPPKIEHDDDALLQHAPSHHVFPPASIDIDRS
jgi:hypothetical protein